MCVIEVDEVHAGDQARDIARAVTRAIAIDMTAAAALLLLALTTAHRDVVGTVRRGGREGTAVSATARAIATVTRRDWSRTTRTPTDRMLTIVIEITSAFSTKMLKKVFPVK